MTETQMQTIARIFVLIGLICFALAVYAQEPLHLGIMAGIAIFSFLVACSLNSNN